MLEIADGKLVGKSARVAREETHQTGWGKTLVTLFEERVERAPHAPAVTFRGGTITYAELNARANQLAHYLQGVGVGPETLVGLAIDRSTETVIAILGVLKAGGAYVPLDPSYPLERLIFVLSDAGVPVVITYQAACDSFPSFAGQVVDLGREAAQIGQQPTYNPCSGASAENLAYVIYTSGSTGTPKGVMVTHHNVVRLFHGTEQWYEFNEHDVWTLFHSYAFDFSVWELWGALLYGGRLVVVPYLISRAPDAFYQLLIDEQVTVLNQTPSAFRQLMAVDATQTTPSKLALRYVIFGGEALDIPSLGTWFDRHGDTSPRLVNMYGITETTVHVTYRTVGKADVNEGAPRSAIGRPIPDLQLMVLDEHLSPIAQGEVGELYVGGAGLARGYLNRPELTKQRFLSGDCNPFGVRLYRTGDLARVLPNGDFDYIGRVDHQVKIRGFRIELGEISAALKAHPAVDDAIILVDDGGDENKRLIAYVALATGKAGERDVSIELRRYLGRRLPAHMVPSAVATCDAFPLTPNGKVDRDALRLLAVATASGPPRAGTEALTDLQRTVAMIWREVLSVDQIDLDQSFFDLGGDSILLAVVASRLRAELGRSLSAMDLFRFPTIRSFSEHLDSGPTANNTAELARARAQKAREAALRLARPA